MQRELNLSQISGKLFPTFRDRVHEEIDQSVQEAFLVAEAQGSRAVPQSSPETHPQIRGEHGQSEIIGEVQNRQMQSEGVGGVQKTKQKL